MSEGSRSGVNWMRSNWRPRELASAFAMVVFATPGTPSRRTWPPAMRQASMSLSSSVLPTMTLETSARILSERSFTCAAWLIIVIYFTYLHRGSSAVKLSPSLS
jgi:hypothetical protein